MTTMSEPQAVREVHEIRARHYEERKNWTRAQLHEHYDHVAEQAAKEQHVRFIPSRSRKRARKSA
jgi:hypothetical protein